MCGLKCVCKMPAWGLDKGTGGQGGRFQGQGRRGYPTSWEMF